MASLIALSPFGELLPIDVGGVSVVEVQPDQLWSVAPFAGQEDAVSAAMQVQLPACNRRTAQVTWFGHGIWMVEGRVALDGIAALTDQSDAWAVARIDGARAEDVLSRLVPIDLRAHVFGQDHVAKTMLGHMSVTITRVGAQAFEIMVMRSMAATLVHEIEVAMRGVAAR